VEGSVPQPVAGRAAGREVAVVTVARVPEVARMEVGQAMATMVEEAEMAAAKVEEEEPAKTRGAVAEMVATMARVAMAKARVVAVVPTAKVRQVAERGAMAATEAAAVVG